VPVVTLQGRAFAQRVASSLLHAVQLDELVCHDMDGYRDTVVALATDSPRRAALRRHLAEQRQCSPLFDGAGFARDLEALLLRMWQRALHGAPPQHLEAQVRA
jgi:predicted O-linked N-acetylglucosamine transferase (SPINDLY family)